MEIKIETSRRSPGLLMWFLRPLHHPDLTPSVRDGLSVSEVAKLRHEACQFLVKLGTSLSFPQRTITTSLLYFHYFFAHHSMKRYPPMDMALTALLVASKAEETYKKIRQILTAAVGILNPQVQNVDGAIVEEHRRRVVALEEGLLTTIGFNFDSHPHGHDALLALAEDLRLLTYTDILTTALNYLDQFYLTDLVIGYPPMHLAAAALRESMIERNFSPKNLYGHLTHRYLINADDLTKLIRDHRQQIDLANKK